SSERYKLANGRLVKLPTHDALIREPFICVAQLDAGNNEGKVFLAAPLAPQDIIKYASTQETIRWDDEREMVVGMIEKRFGNLVLESKVLTTITADQRIEILLEVIKKKGLKLIGDPKTKEDFQARVLSLKLWRPEEPWPDLTDQYLIDTLHESLSPFLLHVSRLSELNKLDVHTILLTLIPWDLQQKFDALAPTQLRVPSGSMIPVHYFTDGK